MTARLTTPPRLAELRVLGAGKPAGQEAILAEVEELIDEGVLIERHERGVVGRRSGRPRGDPSMPPRQLDLDHRRDEEPPAA